MCVEFEDTRTFKNTQFQEQATFKHSTGIWLLTNSFRSPHGGQLTEVLTYEVTLSNESSLILDDGRFVFKQKTSSAMTSSVQKEDATDDNWLASKAYI